MSDRIQLKRPSHTGDTQSPQSIFTPVKPSFTPTTQPTQAPPLGHDFSRISIQPKLTVSQPDDPYEQEADRVAGEVMRMGDPMMSGGGVMRSRQDTIHRQCAACEEEVQAKLVNGVVQSKAMVMRSPDEEFQADGNVESQLGSSKGGGSPLPDDVRSFMEPRFGADFSQVRVHTGSEAIQMNQDLNAQAFVHKQDIYFGAGKTPAKNVLTAHELTHVMQQTGTFPSIQAKQEQKSQVSDMLQLACLPAAACPAAIPGAAGDFGVAEATAEVGPRGRRASMSPARQRSTGHVGHARQLEQFLNAQSPGLLAQIHGIFIDRDMSPGTGAITMSCDLMVPPITGAVLPCVFIPAKLNQEALAFNTTSSPMVGGLSREDWRVQNLQTLTHEIQHVIFDSAAHSTPAGATCARADVDFELSELNAIISEFPSAFRAIPAGANSSHPASIRLANWFSNAITNPSESIAGILHQLRCRCNCVDVNAYVVDTFTFVANGWSVAERDAFNIKLREPHWNLNWPL